MNLNEIFSTQERIRILTYLFEHQDEKISIKPLARKLKLSPGLVHKYLHLLKKNGLLAGGKIADSSNSCQLHVLLNLQKLERSNITGIVRKCLPEATSIGVYGSWSDGTNTPASDLDLWIKTSSKPSDSKLALLKREIEQKIGCASDIIIVDESSLKRLREKSDAFYYSLYFSKRLWGEGL